MPNASADADKREVTRSKREQLKNNMDSVVLNFGVVGVGEGGGGGVAVSLALWKPMSRELHKSKHERTKVQTEKSLLFESLSVNRQ